MIKNLLAIYGKQKKLFYLTLIIKLFEFVFLGASFTFIYLSINALFNNTLTSRLAIYYGLGFLLSLLFSYILDNLHRYKINVEEYYIFAKERIKLGNHLKNLPMGYFNDTNSGELSNTLTESIKSIELIPYLFSKIVAIIAFVFIFIIAFIIFNWRLSAAMFFGFPFAIYMLIKVINVGEKELLIRQSIQGRLADSTVEFVFGIKEAKAFGQSSSSLKNYQKAVQDFKKQNIKMEKLALPKILIYQLSVDMGLIAVMLLGSYLFIIEENLTIPIFLFVLLGTFRVYISLQEVAAMIFPIQHGNAGMKKINDIYKNNTLSEPFISKPIKDLSISFNNVSFAYDSKFVLNNISFTVLENTTTALMGPSGSGKTTITKLIARMWDIENGTITLGGTNIKDLKTEDLLHHLSIVFQDVYLFNDTIENNIKIGNQNATKQEVISAAKKANCHTFIQSFPDQYETVVGEGGGKLSGGEKQRVSIARAFLKDAPIILLDEATANIDPENEFLVQTSINNLVKNKTVIIIAHKISTLMSADQVIVLDNGEIVQRGTHETLNSINGGIYRNYRLRRQKARGWKIAN